MKSTRYLYKIIIVRFTFLLIVFVFEFVSATFLLVFFLILKEATGVTRKKKLFHFKSSLCSRKNQSLEFWIFEFHDFIKCPSIEKKRQTSNNVAGAAFNKEFHFTHASFMKIACLGLHRYYQKQPLNRFWKKVLKKLEQIL